MLELSATAKKNWAITEDSDDDDEEEEEEEEEMVEAESEQGNHHIFERNFN